MRAVRGLTSEHVPPAWFGTTKSAYIHPGEWDIIRSVNASSQEGGDFMFARVIHFDVRSERIQKGYRSIVEHVLPALEMQKGYSGALLLANSQQGKMLAVSLWESEQEMHATDEASQWFRLFGAEAAEGKVTDVETYEVYIARLDHPQP
jgi:heme-degrading monooxygenase HmoA